MSARCEPPASNVYADMTGRIISVRDESVTSLHADTDAASINTAEPSRDFMPERLLLRGDIFIKFYHRLTLRIRLGIHRHFSNG